MKIDNSKTGRGFDSITFVDRYEAACSLQTSSIATEDAIWFGIDKAEPKVLAAHAARHGVVTTETSGWVPYPIPDEVMISTRMHLTREQVEQLLPILQRFVDTGEIVDADGAK